MSIDQSITSSLLKHETVKEAIVESIASGELRPGERLPSIRAIADEHGVSVAPVRQAFAELTERGMIESLPRRRGMFVQPRSSQEAKQKLDAIAVAYEGAQYHQRKPGRLASQLLVEVLAEQAVLRHHMLRPIPHSPVPADGQDDELLRVLTQHRVVVFIHPVYLHWAKHLESHGCRVFFLLTDMFYPGVNYLSWNTYTAQRRIVEYLIELGHQRIAYIGRRGGTGIDETDEKRKVGEPGGGMKYAGYHDALIDAGLPIKPLWTPSHFTLDGYRETRRMLERLDGEQLPTAIAAANDIRALGVIDALNEAGLNVPGDVSVVGMDDRSEAEMAQPPLTSIGPDRVDMARTVLDFVEADESSHEKPPSDQRVHREMPCELVERQSTAPPKGH